MIDYLVEVWDYNKQDWFPIQDFTAGLPLGKIIFDGYEQLTLAQAQVRKEDLSNCYPGLRFRLNKVFSSIDDQQNS